jgi:protein AroM
VVVVSHSAPRVAAITIGQSPRGDLVSDFQELVPNAGWSERGALDGLDDYAIAALAPRDGDFPLVTRLRSGRTVEVGARAITPLLQQVIDRASNEAELILLLCSGPLEVFSTRPLVLPDRLLAAAVGALAAGRRVAVLTPAADQVAAQTARWRQAGVTPLVLAASPWEREDVAALGQQVRDEGATLVVLDCMAYSQSLKAAVASASGVPTILARSLVARLTAELLA